MADIPSITYYSSDDEPYTVRKLEWNDLGLHSEVLIRRKILPPGTPDYYEDYVNSIVNIAVSSTVLPAPRVTTTTEYNRRANSRMLIDILSRILKRPDVCPSGIVRALEVLSHDPGVRPLLLDEHYFHSVRQFIANGRVRDDPEPAPTIFSSVYDFFFPTIKTTVDNRWTRIVKPAWENLLQTSSSTT